SPTAPYGCPESENFRPSCSAPGEGRPETSATLASPIQNYPYVTMVFVVGQAWRWHNVLAVDPREDGRVPRAGCAIRCGPHHGEAYTVNPGKAERERDGLTDSFGRRFRYLRLSITEVCNFRCIYCLPNGYGRDPQAQFLSLEE